MILKLIISEYNYISEINYQLCIIFKFIVVQQGIKLRLKHR